MPYNNTPIAPSNEVSGHVSLPLARVQKIIQADVDRGAKQVSKNAAFAIALATEIFIQHLATTTHNVVKAERKPRRNIQYRDVASAVAKTDNLEFLVDVVPRTVLYKEFKAKQVAGKKAAGVKDVLEGMDATARASEAAAVVAGPSGAGVNGIAKGSDSTLSKPPSEGTVTKSPSPEEQQVDETPDAMDIDDDENADEDEEPEEDGAAAQIEMEMRGPPKTNGTSPVVQRRVSGFTAINGST